MYNTNYIYFIDSLYYFIYNKIKLTLLMTNKSILIRLFDYLRQNKRASLSDFLNKNKDINESKLQEALACFMSLIFNPIFD